MFLSHGPLFVWAQLETSISQFLLPYKEWVATSVLRPHSYLATSCSEAPVSTFDVLRESYSSISYSQVSVIFVPSDPLTNIHESHVLLCQRFCCAKIISRDELHRSALILYHHLLPAISSRLIILPLNILLICLLLQDLISHLISSFWPASWSSGQSFWLQITRFRVRFPALTWGFSLWGEDPRGDHGLGS